MATPLRKDRPEEELTTADLAQGPQRVEDKPAAGEMKPVASERAAATQPMCSRSATSTTRLRCFRLTNWKACELGGGKYKQHLWTSRAKLSSKPTAS